MQGDLPDTHFSVVTPLIVWLAFTVNYQLRSVGSLLEKLSVVLTLVHNTLLFIMKVFIRESIWWRLAFDSEYRNFAIHNRKGAEFSPFLFIAVYA